MLKIHQNSAPPEKYSDHTTYYKTLQVTPKHAHMAFDTSRPLAHEARILFRVATVLRASVDYPCKGGPRSSW